MSSVEQWRNPRFGYIEDGEFKPLDPAQKHPHPIACRARWIGGTTDFDLATVVAKDLERTIVSIEGNPAETMQAALADLLGRGISMVRITPEEFLATRASEAAPAEEAEDLDPDGVEYEIEGLPKGSLAARDPSKPAEQPGLFRKFYVSRLDGSGRRGRKHYGCRYFVLDMDCDAHAPAALRAYAASCAETHPVLSADLTHEFSEAEPVVARGAKPELPQQVLEALRFYANGEHYVIDDDKQAFDTVSGEPQNWLMSERDDDITMFEDGSIARAVLTGKAAGFEEPSAPVEGEVFAPALASQTAPDTQPNLQERAFLAAGQWASSNTPVSEALAYRDGFVAGTLAPSKEAVLSDEEIVGDWLHTPRGIATSKYHGVLVFARTILAKRDALMLKVVSDLAALKRYDPNKARGNAGTYITLNVPVALIERLDEVAQRDASKAEPTS